jgi:hypothetical protein
VRRTMLKIGNVSDPALVLIAIKQVDVIVAHISLPTLIRFLPPRPAIAELDKAFLACSCPAVNLASIQSRVCICDDFRWSDPTGTRTLRLAGTNPRNGYYASQPKPCHKPSGPSLLK